MNRKLTLVFLPVFLCSALFFSGCRSEKQKKRGKVVRVTLSKLQKGIFQERIPIKGNVESVEHATISARTEGTLDDFKTDEGMFVKKGDLLFSIDRVTLENDVMLKKEEIAVAETELSTAEIELKLAHTRKQKAAQDYKRARSLITKSVISTSDYETEEVNLKAMTAAVEKCQVSVRYRKAKLMQARTNLRIAEKKLKDSMITAPFDCLVSEKTKELGEYVKAGEQILKIENVTNLQIVAYVSAVYHRKIVAGKTKVQISIDQKKLGDAVVTYRAKTIDPSTRTFKIKIKLPETIKLSSGMLCNLDIVLQEAKGYGLPESAILQLGNRFMVYTATPQGTAKAFPVKKGIVDGAKCQILNPEKLMKENILISGQRFVNDGDKLSIAK